MSTGARLRAASLALLAVAPAPAVASADPPPATCRSAHVDGVDTDTCVGNPGVAAGPGDPARVSVVPQFCFGIGFFGCGWDGVP